MAADGVSGRITGLDEAVRALKEIVPKLRVRAIRTALAAGARVYRDEAKRLTPVLSVAVRSRAGVRRNPGTVRNAIRVRTSKQAKRAGDVGVFVNVVPAKGAAFKTVKGTALLGLVKTRTRVQTRASKRGANSPTDPFYWRFIEFGTRKMRAFGFLQASARSQGGAALSRIVAALGPAVEKLNQKDGRP